MSAPLTVACPSCRKPVAWEGNPSRPFCSERCRLIDLGQWASEEYRIPVTDSTTEGETEPLPSDVE